MIPFFGPTPDKLPPGIRFLDYLNLIESRAGVLWRSSVIDIDHYWRKNKKCNRIMSRYGLDTSTDIYKNIYIRPKYMSSIECNCYIATSDLQELLSKNSELEMCLRTGHLFDELCCYIVQAKDKSKAANQILKIIDRAQYCRLFCDFTLAINLKKIFKTLERLNLNNELPSFAKIVVEFLKLFCARESMVYYLFSSAHISFTPLIECAQREHFDFFGLWGEKGGLFSYQLTDVSLLSERKTAETLLLDGGVNCYNENSYQLVVKVAANNIQYHFGDDSEERFWECFKIVKKDKTILYRCFQVYILFRSHYGPNCTSQSVLELLWKNISDPFLTFDDFNALNIEASDSRLKDQMFEAWSWYSSTFNLGEGCTKTPRSLQHLAGCVVRKQLVKNFKFPNGVKRLGLPRGLEDHVYISRPENVILRNCA